MIETRFERWSRYCLGVFIFAVVFATMAPDISATFLILLADLVYR
jgi:hypothetical protein